jgi:tetratricopeptide (TPR) repeat protein
MNRRCLLFALLLSCMIGNVARAFDTIKMSKGLLYGKVVGMDSTKVDFQKTTGDALVKQIPANEIEAIFYEGEPVNLKSAKNHVLAGRYAEALAALKKIDKTPDRPEIQQDIEFYLAFCTAKLVAGGNAKISDAGRMMKAFADANEKNYHYFPALEVVGDLLVAVGSYGPAAEYYTRLGTAPWPDYKMRAGVASGRALLNQGKADEALAVFNKVIAVDAEGDAAQKQRLMASLGKAVALVALKKPDEAVKTVELFIEKTDPENVPLMARAYNVLGAAQRQLGHTKEALLAFLHVDVLYAADHDAHAEALSNLADLWEQVHKVERADRARKTLAERYPESPYNKKGGGDAGT